MAKLRRLPPRSLAAGLVLGVAMTLMAADTDTTPKKDSKPIPDPPGTGLYMGQLRALFDAWDEDKDGFLTKEELAHAFRGPKAKPYDYVPPPKSTSAATGKDDDKKDDKSETDTKSTDTKPAKKPDYSRFPDYNVLVQLDQDSDGMISRDEFLSWARDYAVQLKQQADAQQKLLAAQQKLATAKANPKTTAKALAKLEGTVKSDQQSLDGLASKMKAADKAIQQVQQTTSTKK